MNRIDAALERIRVAPHVDVMPSCFEPALKEAVAMRDMLDTVYNRLPNGPEWEILKKQIKALLEN
jgi:hypothetical protein